MAMERRKQKTLTLRLPYPPSVNTYWRNIGRGRTILSKRGREYKRDVQAAVLEQMGRRKAMSGRLRVSIWLTMPDHRCRDISNTIKAAEDALTTAGVWHDDEQIDQLVVYRLGVSKPGWATVRIRELT